MRFETGREVIIVGAHSHPRCTSILSRPYIVNNWEGYCAYTLLPPPATLYLLRSCLALSDLCRCGWVYEVRREEFLTRRGGYFILGRFEYQCERLARVQTFIIDGVIDREQESRLPEVREHHQVVEDGSRWCRTTEPGEEVLRPSGGPKLDW